MMTQCPKFHVCSAPLCPLDEHWRKRRHLKGERICQWLVEAVKPTRAQVFGDGTLRYLLEMAAVFGVAYPDVARKLEAAKVTGSRRLGNLAGSDAQQDPLAHLALGHGIKLTNLPNDLERPSLSGDQCYCSACRELFNSPAAFDAHRTGSHTKGERRCLTTAEIQERGMPRNADGYWITGEMPGAVWRKVSVP